MKFTAEKIDSIPIHFVLCTERTGSSLLSLMLNLNPQILCPSEEPFALYLWKKYRNKTMWSITDIHNYVDAFFLLAEKNTDLYFSKRTVFLANLLEHQDILTFKRIIKLTYLHFLDVKDKSQVTCIVDKQIKYFFHLKLLKQIFPHAKYVVLTRDVRDNIVSKKDRNLNWNQHPFFLASLWNDTYRNIEQLPKSDFRIVSYENFMMETEGALREICDWMNCTFNSKMMETEGVYDAFLAAKKRDVSILFIEHLRDFHSGLSQKPNTNKIGQYKSRLDTRLISQIERICGETLQKLGYSLDDIKTKKAFFKQVYFQFLAFCYRRYLLQFYYHIPLWLKLSVKKWRTKKIDV